MATLDDHALDIIFRKARTFRRWQKKPLAPGLLQSIYELARLGPTSSNCNPGRFVFVVSPEAKARLKPHLDVYNVEKTMTAPATAIIAYDLDFRVHVPALNPNAKDALQWFADPEKSKIDAFRNGSLQGAYFIVAARALGLDCGPMSGFDNDGVDKEFFLGTGIKSNFLCNLGYGDAACMPPRAPRLGFSQACRVL